MSIKQRLVQEQRYRSVENETGALHAELSGRIDLFNRRPNMYWVAADIGKNYLRAEFDGVTAGNWFLRAAMSAARQGFHVYLDEYLWLAKEAFMFAGACGYPEADGKVREIEKKLRLELMLSEQLRARDYADNPINEL